MNLLPMEKLGPRVLSDGTASFGIFLPKISADDGNRLWVKIIHERDQFIQDIKPLAFEMVHSEDQRYGDYWSVKLKIEPDLKYSRAWGTPGRYVYRYYLENPNLADPVDWIVDPFGREFGVGKMSAFTLGFQDHTWNENEESWKTPPLEELVFYELMINEFGGSIDDAIDKLDYLEDLGINCLEVMPVSNVAATVDWGFLPLGYFGVDDRFGNRRNLQEFVDQAHQRNMAVVLDVVYGHTSSDFAYSYLYRNLKFAENPFLGHFVKEMYGEGTDFSKEFTRDFFFTVNYHWLDKYHVDGFRYDCVPEYWDGPMGDGYARLVFKTYEAVKSKKGSAGHWQRFISGDSINLIQCAEQLETPVEVLNDSYSNCTWQNGTLNAAFAVATRGDQESLTELGFRLGLIGYPTDVTANGDRVRKTAIQFLENHDHPRFICSFGTTSHGSELLSEGKRNLWYKLQPYLIGLFTAKGIPMLWQGQEFCENYSIPPDGPLGMGRILIFRPMRWDYFYDEYGRATVGLVRRLIKIRKQPQFLKGDHHFYNDPGRYQSKRVLLFSRSDGKRLSLVGLNFGDSDQEVSFRFPLSGDYLEELHGQDDLENVQAESEVTLKIPGNYGRIWTVQI